jgi:hypothetical protein
MEAESPEEEGIQINMAAAQISRTSGVPFDEIPDLSGRPILG